MTSVYFNVIVKNDGVLSYFFWTRSMFYVTFVKVFEFDFEVVVEFPSLETFKGCLHAILCHVLWDDPARAGKLD